MSHRIFHSHAIRELLHCYRADQMRVASLCGSIRSNSTLEGSLKSPHVENKNLRTRSTDKASLPALSIMPTPLLIRTLMVTVFLSSPRLVGLCLPVMEKLSTTQSWMLSPDKNPILKAIMKFTFYNNFAAGENETQVRHTVARLRQMGCYGVILGYAKETMAGNSQESGSGLDQEISRKEIEEWKEGNLRTVAMVGKDDFVAVKYSGAGALVVKALAAGDPPPAEFRKAMEDIIIATMKKRARIVIDAEQQYYQKAIDSWTLDWQRQYNIRQNLTSNGPPIYNTMQAYLKSTPQKLTEHANLAQKQDFILALKMVRGAYIASETRSLIHDTKAETDEAYNMMIRQLIQKSLPGVAEPFPTIRFVVAGHNEESVERALEVQEEEIRAARATVGLEFGQIQGMADEITCSLAQMRKELATNDKSSDLVPRVYKALTWGSVQELMQNLIRRAVENKAAVERTREWRSGLWKEVKRRMLGGLTY